MKRAKFYCENCHREVRPDSKVCPHCGRFFAAVRCPSCGYTGESLLFLSGCPSCGYAGNDRANEISAAPGEVERYDFEAIAGSTDGERTTRSARRSGRGVPSWFYPVAGIVLLFCLIILIVIYLTMGKGP